MAMEADAELLSGFGQECEQKVEDLEGLVLQLENNPKATELGKQIYRILHTIKGTAASVGLAALAKYTHRFEDYIVPFREGAQTPSDIQITQMLKAVEVLRDNMAMLKKGQLVQPSEAFWDGPTTQAQVEEQVSTALQSKVSVELAVIDDMLARSANLMIIRDMVVQDLERASFENPRVLSIRRCLSLLEDMEKENDLLQRRVGDLRKTRVSSALRLAQRAIRDLSIQLGKKIKLEMIGTNLAIDYDVCQVLADALVHIVRNAVDHGIETPAERLQGGKPEEAKISILVNSAEEELSVAISDDGRGIDADKIKNKALEKKLRTADKLGAMSNSEIFGLIFESGFSTAEKVTEVSGRGVGLDMVMKGISDLKGRVTVDSELGRGTRFTIRIPEKKATNISQALVVRSHSHHLAVPSSEITSITALEQLKAENKVLQREEGIYVEHNGRYLLAYDPVADFEPTHLSGFIVFIDQETRSIALRVDAVESLDQVIVKDISSGAEQPSRFKQAALSGRFGLILYLDINEIK